MIRKLLILTCLLLLAIPVLAQDEETAMFSENTAIVRFAHLIPDAPAVDIYLNGEMAIEALAFTEVADWEFVDGGRYLVEIYETGTGMAMAMEDTASDEEASPTKKAKRAPKKQQPKLSKQLSLCWPEPLILMLAHR